jgi:hypothetical protein
LTVLGIHFGISAVFASGVQCRRRSITISPSTLTRVLSGQDNHLVRRMRCKVGNSRCPLRAELVAIAT